MILRNNRPIQFCTISDSQSQSKINDIEKQSAGEQIVKEEPFLISSLRKGRRI